MYEICAGYSGCIQQPSNKIVCEFMAGADLSKGNDKSMADRNLIQVYTLQMLYVITTTIKTRGYINSIDNEIKFILSSYVNCKPLCNI